MTPSSAAGCKIYLSGCLFPLLLQHLLKCLGMLAFAVVFREGQPGMLGLLYIRLHGMFLLMDE